MRLFQEIIKYGLFVDNRGSLYPKKYDIFLKTDTGIWQQPEELSDLLEFLIENGPIKSFLNIGTFNGCTLNIIHDCLKKINPDLFTCTLDPIKHPITDKRSDITYMSETSTIFEDSIFEFDFVFIDGDHHYDSVVKDYENVGCRAKYCAFHDIKDSFIKNNSHLHGGPTSFWEEYPIEVPHKKIEFISQLKPIETMGIGLIIHE